MRRDCFLSELMEPEELEKLVRDYGCGLELIAFSVAENLDRFSRTLGQERELLARLGNPPCTLHGPFLDLNPAAFDSRIRQVTLDRFSQALEAARELGAEKVVFHSGMVPTVYFLEGWSERVAEFWQEFFDHTEPGKVTVCMENVLDPDPEAFLAAAAAVRHPAFGVCLDLGHAHCYGQGSVLTWLEKLGALVRHLHVHDNGGDRDAHLGLGEGTIPYDQVWEMADRLCPEASVTLECADPQAAARSLDRLSRIVI